MMGPPDAVRILILDDQRADAELTRLAFDRSDMRVHAEVATDEASFRQALSREGFDVVLVDYRLPRWTGLDALDAVRGMGLEIPVIMVTGTLSDREALDCIKRGIADYVLKDNLSRLPFAVLRALDDMAVRHETSRAWKAFHQIAEGIDEVFFTVDLETQQTTYINPAYERVFGQSAEDLRGNPRAFLDHVQEEDRERLIWYIERVRRGEPEGKIEFRITRPDQQKRTLLAHAMGIPANDGVVRSVSGIALDITETRRLEQQFQQAQKMEAVGRLAGGIAHDFNNLLTVIITYSQFLTDQVAPGQQSDDLREIQRAAESAAGLTRQLLMFSRQSVVEPQVVDLANVVDSAESLLRRVIGEDITLSTSVSGHARVKVDRGQLEQVVMNLAVNARDAMPAGGTLRLETSVTTVSDEVARLQQVSPGRFAVLTVADTGQGMNEHTLQHAFEPFFTTKGVGKGTGLGLATVYGIVKQRGGFLRVTSEVGRGSTFRLYFPATFEQPESPVADAAEPPAGGPETILLVEDAAAVRTALESTLTRLGYSVIPAATGDAALAAIQRHGGPIHLLVTDVVMPGMSGRDLAAQFRKLQPDVPVLYISGYTAGTTVGDQPNTDYLQKPFTPDQFARKVRAVLDGH